MSILRQISLLLCLYGVASNVWADAPKVLTSIKPIYNITAAISQGVFTPQLLLTDVSSPHDYQLKPSDVMQILDSDLIVWVGPELEGFLVKPLKNMPSKLLTLIQLDKLHKLTVRNLEINQHSKHEHQSEHQHEGHTHSSHAPGSTDPHIWLALTNAKVIAQAIGAKLIELDPENRAIYQANLANFIEQCEQKLPKWRIKLAPFNQAAFIAMHDAYQYFEKEFKLKMVGSIHVSPEIPISAKHLSHVKRLLQEHNVRCIFSEPQLGSQQLTNIIGNTKKIGVATIDPLGQMQDLGSDGYFKLIENLVEAVASCEP